MEKKSNKVLNFTFKSTAKRSGIFKDVFEDVLYHALQLHRNPNLCIKALHVKIVDLDKFIKRGFCWYDSNGEIKNSEPFKVGDVGYVNLIEPAESCLPDIIIETYAEKVGVELLKGQSSTIDVIVEHEKPLCS